MYEQRRYGFLASFIFDESAHQEPFAAGFFLEGGVIHRGFLAGESSLKDRLDSRSRDFFRVGRKLFGAILVPPATELLLEGELVLWRRMFGIPDRHFGFGQRTHRLLLDFRRAEAEVLIEPLVHREPRGEIVVMRKLGTMIEPHVFRRAEVGPMSREIRKSLRWHLLGPVV